MRGPEQLLHWLATHSHCAPTAPTQQVQDANSGEETEVTAGMVVNAAGLHAQVGRFAGHATAVVCTGLLLL